MNSRLLTPAPAGKATPPAGKKVCIDDQEEEYIDFDSASNEAGWQELLETVYLRVQQRVPRSKSTRFR
jgi:hypothetical protein